MIQRLSIRTKIFLTIAVLLVLMASMGGVAVYKMHAINDRAAEIQRNWLPSVRALGELRVGASNFRTILRGHLLADTSAAKNDYDKRVQVQIEAIGKARRTYDQMISSPSERAIYDEWSREWAAYMKVSDRVLSLSRGDKGGSQQDAVRLNEAEGIALGRKSDALLVKASELNDAGANAAGDAASNEFSFAIRAIVGMLIVATAIGIGVGIYLVGDVSKGISAIVKPMQALGSGDLAADVPFRGMKTEMGTMSDALQVFKQALIDKHATDEAAAAEAEAKIERARRVDGITRDFEAMIGEVVETVSSASTELEASAGTLTATASRAQEITNTVAAASEQASANVQSVASATEEMSSSIHEIARQVQESARIAGQAVEQAEITNGRVGELATAAARIGDVVELINTIAGQTNLLALNATIEAARAGDAGRGFAVVASEVKLLAEQTAKATGEISAQIAGIQNATQESVDSIRTIGGTIGRMSEIASTISAAVEQQGAATQEISRNVQQAAHGTVQVSANIGDVQRGAAETGSASSQVLAAARSLSTDSTRLKTEVACFLAAVRAA